MIYHPFMSLAQPGDPPRHPPMVHDDTFVEPNITQHPVATTTMDKLPAYVDAPVHVEHPRHVVVKYILN